MHFTQHQIAVFAIVIGTNIVVGFVQRMRELSRPKQSVFRVNSRRDYITLQEGVDYRVLPRE
jgi:hypothetical protein